MMIYGNIRKSKPKLRPKKEREEYQAWLEKHKVGTKTKTTFQPLSYKLTAPVGREAEKIIPSINTGNSPALAKEKMMYTGDKMLGIGTLHKSNAVPVFSQEEAQDMAKMRR
jgi:hypothetical protein